MNKAETVEVKVKVPKPLFEFLQAVLHFTKCKETVEEICSQAIIHDLACLDGGNTINEIFQGFDGKRLIKTYNLEKVF